MAETRKFDPSAGSDIAQALRKAMGEPVRPNTPGQTEASPNSGARKPVQSSPRVTSGAIWDPFLKTQPGKPTKPPTPGPLAG